MAFKDNYFLSKNVKVFPSAFRGENEDLKSRFPTEYNLIHTGNIGKNKSSFVLDYAAPIDGNGLLKCVIGGYYFEITIRPDDLASLKNTNFYINTKVITLAETENVSDTAAQDLQTSVLASFINEADLDYADPENRNEDTYFTGLMFANKENEPDSYAEVLEEVLIDDGQGNIIDNPKNRLPIVNTGNKANSITFGDKGTDKNVASGDASFAHGFSAIADGSYSHAEGWNTKAIGYAAHAEGGNATTANNQDQVYNIASGDYSHVEGLSTAASGEASHAEGNGTIASGNYSHAEGQYTKALGIASHAEGDHTIASSANQTVVGKYNAEEAGEFIVGIGADNNNRKNALVVNGTGTTIYENLYIKDNTATNILSVTKAASQLKSNVIELKAGVEHLDINSTEKFIKLCLHQDVANTSRGKLVLNIDNNKTKAELNAANIDLVGDTKIVGTLSTTGKLTVSNTTDMSGADIFGVTNLNGTTDITGKTTILDTTDASNSAGALKVAGGARIDKKLNVGGNTTLGGTLDISGTTTLKGANANLVISPDPNSTFNMVDSQNNLKNMTVNANTITFNAGSYQYTLGSIFRQDYNNMSTIFGLENYDEGKKLRLNTYDTNAANSLPFEINSSELILRKNRGATSCSITVNLTDTDGDIIPGSGSPIKSENFYLINIKGDESNKYIDIDKDCDIYSTGGIYINGESQFNDKAHFNNSVTISKDVKIGSSITLAPANGKVTAKVFNATSDKRLKKNLMLYTPKKSILDLPIYKFDYIVGDTNQIGCMAQDLQEICPELVDKTDSGLLTIQETKLVYLLLDEVKKLRKEIKDLKK